MLDLRKGPKESRLESLRQEKQAVRGKGSSAAHDKYYVFEDISSINSDATQDSSCLDTDEAKNDETNDSDNSNMDLSNDDPKGDDDAVGFGYIQNLFNEPLVNELTDLMSNPMYNDAHITSAVANPEGNHKEMFLDKAAHHISSPPTTTTYNPIRPR
ncbi:hypothetical protein Tco_1369909 [Tanacetum coccineum]